VFWVQVPAPLHWPTLVCTPVEHDAEPHAVPVPGNVHAVWLVPSQYAPHVPLPVHAVRRPVVWAGPVTATQVPTLPVTSHAWHWPEHAVLQHTPSTQLLLAHSPAALQVVPFGFEQCPAAPGTLHAKPVELQTESQHVLLAQLPDAHALALVQPLPFASFGEVQVPALQK